VIRPDITARDPGIIHPRSAFTREPVLSVSNLSIRFKGHPVDMIEDVGFTIHAGKTLCVVGESGCGKSVRALRTLWARICSR
jgi:ABC-type glutathione transport system ATPase component